MENKTILCVEDNEEIQTSNKMMLEIKGHTVRQAITIAEAWKFVSRETPALIVLDIHLPDGNGLDFLREFRKTSTVPVIALTNDREEQDIVKGLNSGCDDYISKPYVFSILYARIEALLRRAEQVPEIITKGRLSLDVTAGLAMFDGTDLMLTQKEISLLLVFVQHEGRFIESDYLYEKVWKAPMGGDSGVIRKTISVIRNKIKGCGWMISWSNGEGYMFMRE